MATASLDRAITEFDRALRTVAGSSPSYRPSPANGLAEGELSAPERAHSAALMRVNHVGEVCAQALYQGQSLTAKDPRTFEALQMAAKEEQDHLSWSNDRIRELGGQTSALNPLWYAGALFLGAASGMFGDRWNLAFLAETERQVETHLAGHLTQISPADHRTLAVVDRMRVEEGQHRAAAITLGGAELPSPVKKVMKVFAKVMTTIAYRI